MRGDDNKSTKLILCLDCRKFRAHLLKRFIDKILLLFFNAHPSI